MARFGRRSKRELKTCEPELQRLLNEAIKVLDFSVLEGHRGQEDQDKAYRDGFSKLMWPDGRHNKSPSRAVDLAPYPIDFQDIKRFEILGWFVKGLAKGLGIKVIWGGDWANFRDWGHFELVD